MEYLRLFETHQEYETFVSGGTMVKPNVSHCVVENEVHYNPHTFADEYLTFDALEDGTFTFTLNKEVSTDEVQSISYSLDGGENWVTTDNVNNQIVTITTPTVNGGDSIIWKGTATRLGKSSSISEGVPLGATIISSTNKFEAKGNIMSLLYGDEYKNKTDLTNKDYCFWYLFRNCINLQSISKLSLPATTLANNCYQSMFYGCTSLINATELPATTLADYCCAYMFEGCTSLTTAPELPATTLAVRCYLSMFKSCTSLTTTPQLSATTLADWCYADMFQDCTSIVSSFSVLPATILATYCYRRMFRGCTSLVNAPKLPATTLPSSCYRDMFYGCTNLSSITCLATDISATNCTTDWVNGVSASGTFTKAASMSSWTTGNSGIPNGWTVQDAS